MTQLTLFTDERGVNTVVGYVLALAISTILISTLVVGSTSFLRTQQGTVITTEMDVTGNQLASDIEATDRYVRADGAGTNTIDIHSSLPEDFAGADYTITIQNDASRPAEIYDITLKTRDPSIQWTVSVWSKTDIQTGTVPGGDAVISYDGSQLVIRNA